uniref:Uncharacterized protein n=1 Tax=Arundo donax TaxID=35708 RepID=A0A0A8Z4X1_ARUDO
MLSGTQQQIEDNTQDQSRDPTCSTEGQTQTGLFSDSM